MRIERRNHGSIEHRDDFADVQPDRFCEWRNPAADN
jgi:hypothetical protein